MRVQQGPNFLIETDGLLRSRAKGKAQCDASHTQQLEHTKPLHGTRRKHIQFNPKSKTHLMGSVFHNKQVLLSWQLLNRPIIQETIARTPALLSFLQGEITLQLSVFRPAVCEERGKP